MRVLLTTDAVGGVWTFSKDLAGELLRGGHTVGLLCFGPAPSSSQRAWANAVELEYAEVFCFVAVEVALEWMQENQGAYDDGFGAMLRLVDEMKPDVIHVSQFCFGRLPVGLPVVITAHSDVLSWAEACEPEALLPTPWLDRYRRLVQAGLDRAAAVVAPTAWMLDALRRNFAFSAGGAVVPNGRSLPVFAGQGSGTVLRAVSAGRFWDRAKNLELLRGLDSPMPLVVAGSIVGDPDCAAVHGVEWVGVLDEDALLSLFRSSTVYVAPSLYEPFGLAPLEAALCGCALLLNDLASFREVWGEAALYFHDAASLRRQLDAILAGEHDLQMLQECASARARELTAERMAERYMDVYQTVLHAREPAHSVF